MKVWGWDHSVLGAYICLCAQTICGRHMWYWDQTRSASFRQMSLPLYSLFHPIYYSLNSIIYLINWDKQREISGIGDSSVVRWVLNTFSVQGNFNVQHQVASIPLNKMDAILGTPNITGVTPISLALQHLIYITSQGTCPVLSALVGPPEFLSITSHNHHFHSSLQIPHHICCL